MVGEKTLRRELKNFSVAPKQHPILFGYIILMLSLLFVRNALQISIPVSVLLAITIISLLFASVDETIGIFVTFIPFSTGFQYKYAIFACIIIFLIKSKGKIRLSKTIPIVFLMLFWELLHAFSIVFSVVELLRIFSELFFLCVLTSNLSRKIDLRLIIRSMYLAVIGVCFIMLFIQLREFDFNLMRYISAGSGSFRFGQNNTFAENFGLNFNANGLGTICAITLSCILILIRKSLNNIVDVVAFVLVAFFGLLTLSRTYIFLLIFILIYYLIFAHAVGKRKIRGFLTFVFLIFASIILLYFIFPQVAENIFLRFSENDVTGGRTDLFAFYHKHIFASVNNILFGIGIQGFSSTLAEIYGYNVQVCHNSIQELWVAWGLPGVIAFIVLLLGMLSDSGIRFKRETRIYYLPLLLLLFSSMAGQLIRSGNALMELSVAYLALYAGGTQLLSRSV